MSIKEKKENKIKEHLQFYFLVYQLKHHQIQLVLDIIFPHQIQLFLSHDDGDDDAHVRNHDPDDGHDYDYVNAQILLLNLK